MKALAQGGFTDVAQDMLNIQKAKLTGDYLHTSAIIVGDGQVLSAVNDVTTMPSGNRLSPAGRTLGRD